MSRVWKYSKQEGTKLLLLLALADFARDDGRAWPAVATLAKKARCKKRNAQYILRELVKIGEIEIDKRAGPNGTNLYRIIVGVQPIAPPTSGGEMQSSVGGGATQRTERVQPIAPEPSLTIKEPLKDSRSKTKRSTNNRVRKALEEQFIQSTRLKPPLLNTAKQKKAAGELWWAPLREIAELSAWDELFGRSLISRTVQQMRKDKLTISSPKSIMNVARSIVAEGSGSSVSGAREFLNELRGSAT